MSEVFPIPAMPILTVPGGGTGPAGPTGPAGVGWNVYTVATGATVAAFDFVLVDTTAGPVTIILPSPIVDTEVKVKKKSSDSNAVTVSGTIDGQAAWTLGLQYSGVAVTGNGTAWWTG